VEGEELLAFGLAPGLDGGEVLLDGADDPRVVRRVGVASSGR
jgi:hypothetical protein